MAAEANSQLIEEVSRIVNRLTGIQLGAAQTNMVKHRLQRRMIDLEIDDPDDYLEYLKGNLQSESDALVSLITTHHTYFFREFSHFEFLEEKGLRRLIEVVRKEGRKVLRVWSAACSRGHEVYSLSMFLRHHLKQLAPDFDYEIFGSDVDSESVRIAENAVYRWADVKECPSVYLIDSWVRGTGDIADYVKAKPSIRSRAKFATVNLMELGQAKLPYEKFDLIFCRNVFIYFNQDQIKTLTSQFLSSRLTEGGLFIIGLSESLHGLNLPAETAGPSVYTHKGYAASYSGASVARPSVSSSVTVSQPVSTAPSLIRVLCVDDSPIILTLLKKILTKERGFEVVATAKNGLEAASELAKHEVDLVTLDIHMPEQDGIEYLKENFSPKHPPVVIVSSVSREDQSLGIKALELGASDFIEKPSMDSLEKRMAEITSKLKSAVKARSQSSSQAPASQKLELDKSFATSNASMETTGRLRVICLSSADLFKVNRLLSQWQKPQAPILLLFNAKEEQLGGLIPRIIAHQFEKPQICTDWPASWKENQILVGSLESMAAKAAKKTFSHYMGMIALGDPTHHVKDLFKLFPRKSLILEEPKKDSALMEGLKAYASFVVPYTSIAYHSDQLVKEAKG